MTNKTFLSLILIGFAGFGCAVETEQHSAEVEAFEHESEPSAPSVFEAPTPVQAAPDFAPAGRSSFDGFDPSAHRAGPEPYALSETPRANAAPSGPSSAYDDPAVGAYGDCAVIEAGRHGIVVSCP